MKTRLEPHGVPHQLNLYVLDRNSEITGHGRHNRIVVSHIPGTNEVIAREDLRDLPVSTDIQRRKVMSGFQRQHPRGARLVYLGAGPEYTTAYGRSIEHRYCWDRAARRRPKLLPLSAIRAMFVKGSCWRVARAPAWEGRDVALNGATCTVLGVRGNAVWVMQAGGEALSFDLPRAVDVIDAREGALKYRARTRELQTYELSRLADQAPQPVNAQ